MAWICYVRHTAFEVSISCSHQKFSNSVPSRKLKKIRRDYINKIQDTSDFINKQAVVISFMFFSWPDGDFSSSWNMKLRFTLSYFSTKITLDCFAILFVSTVLILMEMYTRIRSTRNMKVDF
jgi:hypothetical protein